MSDLSILIDSARQSRERAYARYSGFKVGAALRTASGEIFPGCNVENVSLGLTICAERNAAATAVAAGFQNFSALALVADTTEPIVPCGACRQFLAEFGDDLVIYSSTLDGKSAEFRLSELLPRSRQGVLEGR